MSDHDVHKVEKSPILFRECDCAATAGTADVNTRGVTVGYDHSRCTTEGWTMSGVGVTVLVVVPVALMCAFWTLCSYYNVRRKRARRWDPANLPHFRAS